MKKKIVLVLIFFILLFPLGNRLAFSAYRTDSQEVQTKVGNPAAPAPNTNPGTGEVPPFPADIKKGVYDNFGITVDGFEQDYLEWIWEALWQSTNTNFPLFVRGAVIHRWYEGYSQWKNGEVWLSRWGNDKAYHKFIFYHELGHWIGLSSRLSGNLNGDFLSMSEGAISCYGGTNAGVAGGEDYADMIAYYIASWSNYSSACCGICRSTETNPFFGPGMQGRNPQHFAIMERYFKKISPGI